MRCDLRNRCAASFLAAVLMAVPAAAKDNPAKQTADRLPNICADLQKQGWGVPADELKMNPDTQAETRIGKRLYMCTLERQLAGKGPGRAPDLGVLLASSAGEPHLVFSVNVWCAADREPAIEALAKELERVLTGSKIPIPANVLEAVRASREHDSTAEGVRYRVEPIEVDAGACAQVKPGELGPVLMKMDVAVEPVP
ncbi:MAG TPA: hypothetical protein VEW48_09775 [Thermoanaerobaculia bacterium]|nr:hypothetical protein [Thermoanaerobaculia bacterium]